MSEDEIPAHLLHGTKLTWALGQVEHCRRVLTVTRYGKPVAQLAPIPSNEVALTDPPGILAPRPISQRKTDR